MIPNFIHFVWLGSKISENLYVNVHNYQVLNPKWSVHLWNEELYTEFPILAQMQKVGCDYAWQSDYARILLLNSLGGFYVDVDSMPLTSFDSLPGIIGERVMVCDAPRFNIPRNIETHTMAAPQWSFIQMVSNMENSLFFYETHEIHYSLRTRKDLFVSPKNWFNEEQSKDAIFSIHNDRRLASWVPTRETGRIAKPLR